MTSHRRAAAPRPERDPRAPFALVVDPGGQRPAEFEDVAVAVRICSRFREKGTVARVVDRHGVQVYPEPAPAGARR